MTLDNPPEQAAGFDARFQTAGVAGFEADQSETAEKFEEEEEDASDAEDGQQSEGDGDEDSSRLLKPLSKAELEAFERKQKKRGVIYISHIPHGMTVAKVKHLLEGFGEVDRIFLHDGSVKPGEKRESGYLSNGAVLIFRPPLRETNHCALHRRLGRIQIEESGQDGGSATQRAADRSSGGDQEQHEVQNGR